MSESKKNTCSVIGMVIGMVALGVAVFHFFLGPIEEPPPLEEYVADKAAAIKDNLMSRMKGEELKEVQVEKSSLSPDEIVTGSSAGAGFIALILAALGFVRREDRRMNCMALAFGGGAVAFQFLIMALCTVLVIFLIGAALGTLGG